MKRSKLLTNPKGLFLGLFATALLLQTQGFCDGTAELEATNKTISNFLFGPTIRKIALTLGLGGGLFQAFMSGSFRPLMVYGGLGLAVCYLPKVVEIIGGLGGA